MNLTLQIKDYDTFTPLINKQIQLTNIDSKLIYTQTTDARGYVSFNINESERGDFFYPIIIHKDYHSAQHNLSNNITQRTICPHSYANHTAIVYFKQNNIQSQDNTNLVESIQFLEHIEWGIDSPQQIKIDYMGNKQDDITYPLTYPFAPGTYIELEAKLSDNVESNTPLKWGYIALHNELELQSFAKGKRAYPLQYINNKSQYFHTQNIYNKIGFYLPLQEYAYIAVFVSTSEINTLTDTYLIINTGFKVGKDSRNGVIESKREEQSSEQKAIYNQTSTSNLNEWNKLQCVCNVKEAVEFLKANRAKLNELYQSNQARYNQKDSDGNPIYDVWFDYFRIYPSLAGKIAYIYYRFDVGDEGFVESVEGDNEKYKDDRGKYIKGVKEVFETQTYRSSILNRDITFREAYNKDIFSLMQNGVSIKYPLFHQDLNGQIGKNGISFLQERKNFTTTLVKKICKHFGLKLDGAYIDNIDSRGITSYNNEIFIAEWLLIDSNKTQSHECNGNQSCINIKSFEYLSKRLIGTIAHECRHLYIYEKFYKATLHKEPLLSSILKEYLAVSFGFYINGKNMKKLFQPYKKLCDKTNEMAVYCSTIEGYNYQDAYEIQPNERDPRYVAAQIIGKNILNLK